MNDQDATRAAGSSAPACSPLASWYPLVRAIDGSKTGAYELQVGDLHLRSYDWDEEKAKKWMPVIVAAGRDDGPVVEECGAMCEVLANAEHEPRRGAP
jgi:hypothetical protein